MINRNRNTRARAGSGQITGRNSSTGVYNIDQTFNTADIYSQRMTLWFNSNLVATLNVNGQVKGTSSQQSSGTATNAVLTVRHNYPNWTTPDGTQTISVTAGAQTTIGTGFGFYSSHMAAVHQEAQNQAMANGAGSGDENLLGQSLLLVWDNYAGQASRAADILGRISNTYVLVHHFVTTITQYYYQSGSQSGQLKIVSSALLSSNISTLIAGDDARPANYAFLNTVTALEGTAQQQVSSLPSSSAISIFQLANAAANPNNLIYDARSSNWTTGTNVRSIMQTAGYPSSTLTTIDGLINGNPPWRVAMPNNTQLGVGSFNFYGYLGIQISGSANGPISLNGQTWFGAKGAVAGSYQDNPTTNSAASDNARQVNGFGMPALTAYESARVNMLTGRYEYSSTDLTVGNQGAPYELAFTRSYNSALRLSLSKISSADQGLGFGWLTTGR